MTFQPGDVVTLKSGGQAMTVVEEAESGVACVWIGEEGELFRETLPAAVLQALYSAEDEDSEPEDEENGEEEDDGEDEDEHERKIA
ncbi:MAG: DUF2158 domain-containing protein [Pseudorhodoplanes sp.]|nr:DUF2158 domain-containing protein [Pseudorhodoplanes sp.]